MADLTEQERLARAISATYAQINEQLTQQLLYTNALAEAQKGASADMGAAAIRTNEQLEALQSAGATATTSQTEAAASTDRTTAALAEQNEELERTTTGFGGVGSAAMQAYDGSLKFLQNLIPKDYRLQLRDLHEQFGGMATVMGKDGGPFAATNAQARAFVKTTQEVYTGLLATEGAFADAFGMMPKRALGDLGDVMADFHKLFGDEQGMLNSLKLAKVATGDFVLEQTALAKAAGYTTAQQQTFMSRQISLTGEASTDMLKEAAVFSKRLATMTGDSSKMISQHIAGIIDDTEHFGNVTVAEAARISVTLRQLGMDYSELGGMVGKYMNFEDAAESVSALTTVFGVQIDAMEMMKLANTDQEQFLRRMREQFLATGKSVKDMELYEKQLIKTQLGLSNIEAVERYLDPSAAITSFEELQKGTGDVGKDVSATMKYLAEDIVDLHEAVEVSAQKILDNIQEKIREPFAQTLVEMEQGAGRMGLAMEKAIPAAGIKGLEVLGKGLTDLTGIDTDTIEKIGGGIRDMGTAMAELVGLATDSPIWESIEQQADALGHVGTNIGTSISDGITTAMNTVTADFQRTITNLEDVIKDSPLYGKSPSLIGQAIADGISLPAEELPAFFAATFGEMADEGGRFTEVISGLAAQAAESADGMATITAESIVGLYEDSSMAAVNALNFLAEKEEDIVKKADLLNAASVTARIQSERDYEAAATESVDRMSQGQIDYYNGVTEISARELANQLTQSDSYYTQMARELGRMGLEYETMTDSQKAHYAAQFKLGDSYEAKLKQIMQGEAHALGSKETATQDAAADLLTSMRAEKRTFASFGTEYRAIMEDKYGITEEMLEASMEEGANIEDIVSEGLLRKQAALDAQRAAEATEAEEGAEAQETATQVNRQATSALRAIKISNDNILVQLKNIVVGVKTTIPAAIEAKEFAARTNITLDGRAIVDYIVTHPIAASQPTRIVTKDLSEG